MQRDPISLETFRAGQQDRLMPYDFTQQKISVYARHSHGRRWSKAWQYGAVISDIQGTEKGDYEVKLTQQDNFEIWTINPDGFRTSGHLWWREVGYLLLPFLFREFTTDGSIGLERLIDELTDVY